MSTPNEKPILMSSPMVRAILEGRKTQTRRVIKLRDGSLPSDEDVPAPWPKGTGGNHVMDFSKSYPYWERLDCPYGKIGDALWVRESFWKPPIITKKMRIEGADTWPEWDYNATVDDYIRETYKGWGWKLKPSIHMPRLASRITLQIKNIRVERLQDITEYDAQCEGCSGRYSKDDEGIKDELLSSKEEFEQLWNSLNESRGFGWGKNPLVWVIEFEKQH